MDVFEQETLRRTRYNIEEQQDWRCEIDRLPWIQFPSSWKVKVIPPYGDAVVRFHVKLPNGAEKSVYCDSRNSLGFYTNPPTPYWEVYPYNDDVGRCAVDDVAGLLEMIREGAADDRDSTPDHTEDKIDKVEDQSPYPSIREYNGMLHRFAMDILLKNSNAMIQGEFNPAITAIRNAYEIAGYVIGVGENYEFEEYNGIGSLRSKNTEDGELEEEL